MAVPAVNVDAAATKPQKYAGLRLWLAAGLLATSIWAYWPTLAELIASWNREPDYSHGFLVIPLSIYFCWIRRSSFPGLTVSSPLIAMLLILLAVSMRFVGGRFFYTFLDAWSILPTMAAIAAVVGGQRLLWWCLPSICFLFFMIPLPFMLEGQLSHPLQRIATKLSCLTLQTLGFPAFAEGNVILLGADRFEVAQACSGLRLFISILALTCAYIAIIQRSWWEKGGLALAAIPVAIVANSARIVATAVLYQFSSNESVRHFAHDSAGWATILFAAVLLFALLRYLRLIVREEEIMDVGALVRKSKVARQVC